MKVVDRVTKTKMCCPLIRWRWYNSFIWGRQYFWLFFLVCNIFFFAVVPLIFWGLSRFLIRTAWIKPLWTLWTALDFGDFGHPKILPFLSWGALGSVFWLQTSYFLVHLWDTKKCSHDLYNNNLPRSTEEKQFSAVEVFCKSYRAKHLLCENVSDTRATEQMRERINVLIPGA